MSYYSRKVEQAKTANFNKPYLDDFEAAEYVGVGKTHFRQWAEQIGCRRKIGRRVINDKTTIDEALKRGDTV